MKEYLIKLNDKYNIPSNIPHVTPDEWEIIISYVSDLLLKHDSISSKIAESEVQQLLEAKYTAHISKLEEQVNNNLQEINTMKDLHAKQLKKQRKELEEQLKASNADSMQTIKLSMQESNEAKDVIIQSLKAQLAEMQHTITQFNVDQLNPLQVQLDKYRKQLDSQANEYMQELKSVRESCDKQLKKQRKEFDDQPIHTQLDTYRKQLEEIKLQQLQIISEEKNKLSNILESKYDAQIQKLQKQSSDLLQTLTENHLTEIAKLHEYHNQQLISQKEQEEERMHTKLAEIKEEHQQQFNLQDTLMKSLEPITKHYGGSNTEKGNSGENTINNLLTNTPIYNEAIIEDVSGQAEKGDILFTWKHMKCLIEIKNKYKLTTGDMEKFTRDVAQSYESSNINCALFISLQTNQFPGKSREILQLDYVNGVPVIYTFMPPPSKEIHYAIACLERITKTDETKSHNTAELQQHFINYYCNVLEYQKYFDQELRKHQREVKALTKHFDSFNALCEQLSPIYAKISKTNSTDDPTADDPASLEAIHTEDTIDEPTTQTLSDDPDEHLAQLSEEYIKISLKNRAPTTYLLSQAFGVKDRVVEQIGFKTIATHAKHLYLKNTITDDRLQKIIKFHEDNGRYPNRKELVDKKIFMDHVLRAITKVTKQKKVADVIQDYCISTMTSSVDSDLVDNPVDNNPEPEKTRKIIPRKR